MIKHYITRRGAGKGFSYYDEQGNPVTNKFDLKYFKTLRIPPAWKDVRIATNQRAKILATGVDSAGRLQYIYHPAFRARQEKAKFERILRFARALPEMRKRIGSDLLQRELNRDKVLAAVVKLMDEAYFRVGNDEYAQENEHYGITTLRSKHTTVKGDTITFDFIGKSGKKHYKQITDRQLARIVKKLDELPGYEVFKYYDDDGKLTRVKSEDVNEYIKETMGEEFSAKDFRTWGGTLLASAELALAERAESERERKKTVTACIRNVAKKLGNTPAVCRSSYIDPRIIKAFERSDDLRKVYATVKSVRSSRHFSSDEACVLQLLEQAT